MKQFLLLVPTCALVLALGCGPMNAPLPARLDPETQQAIDNGWNRALAPPERLGHQDLLDVLVGTQAYQLGVDSFTFRAEKRFAGGRVVMEMSYDRASPDNDQFEVAISDQTGKTVRHESYSRKEIEETYNALFVTTANDKGLVKDLPQRRADHTARWERIRSLFPGVKDEKIANAPKPKSKG